MGNLYTAKSRNVISNAAVGTAFLASSPQTFPTIATTASLHIRFLKLPLESNESTLTIIGYAQANLT